MDSLRNFRKPGIIGGVIVLLLAGVGVYLGFFRTRNEPNVSEARKNANVAVAEKPVDARKGIVPADADKDGLTDDREATLGTNPTLADSDRDGLTDFDEVEVYHSDPNKADTDGDGNPDGAEVKKGYSPTGPGSLYDTSKALINAQP